MWPSSNKKFLDGLQVSRISGFIFDLDGTLIDSGLDFYAMRRDMGLAEDSSILEEMAKMENNRAIFCRKILERHELEGAKRAVLIPGVAEFLQHLDQLNIKCAIVTRNSRFMAEIMLEQCGLNIERLIAREDGPVKPDPWAILNICNDWNLNPDRVVMLGDYRYDIEAGNAAGTQTVFFTRGRMHHTLPGIENANFHLDSFQNPENLFLKLGLKLPGS